MKVANPHVLDLFWKFIARRQLAWYRKEILKKPPPYSRDPVLQTSWFTNMYRELDPGTKWCVTNILYSKLDQPSKAFWALFYRYTGSNRSSMEHIEMVPVTEYSEGLIHKTLAKLPVPFGHAYTVYPFTNDATFKSKSELVAGGFKDIAEVWPRLWPRIKEAPDAAKSYEWIRSARVGVGPFTGYQALIDYMMPGPKGVQLVPHHRNDWAVAGPGALAGLRHIVGDEYKLGTQGSLDAMRWLHEQQETKLDWSKPYWLDHHLYLSDIQNCLCEFSKYIRVRTNGRVTRRYKRGGKS